MTLRQAFNSSLIIIKKIINNYWNKLEVGIDNELNFGVFFEQNK